VDFYRRGREEKLEAASKPKAEGAAKAEGKKAK
jgi:hypothetical protein